MTNTNSLRIALTHRIAIRIRRKVINAHMQKLAQMEKTRKRLQADAESLRWSPLIISSSAILEEERDASREVTSNEQC